MLNLYCDESCHLLHQTSGMVLGSVVVPSTTVAKHAQNIRGIKATYGMPVARELKWTRVSPSKVDVYKVVIISFFTLILLQQAAVFFLRQPLKADPEYDKISMLEN